jgi:hypothetical protein
LRPMVVVVEVEVEVEVEVNLLSGESRWALI